MYTTLHDVPVGSIGLVEIPGDVGRAIRFGQWLNGDGYENYEHAFTYLGDGEIIEAEPGGARIVAFHYSLRNVIWLPCPAEYGDAVAREARELEGVPYSFLDYAALATHRLHIPAPGLRDYIADTGHMLCSQLCDEAARRGGWHLFHDGRWAGYVTPGALYALTS